MLFWVIDRALRGKVRKKGVSTIVIKKIPKGYAILCFIVCVCLLGAGVFSAARLPDRLYVNVPQDISLSFPFPMVAQSDPLLSTDGLQPEGGYHATVKLFGVIPIGSTKVKVADEDQVIVGGSPFGIKILADGVLVVGFHDALTADGAANPAKAAGLKEGDLLLSVGGEKLSTNAELVALVERSGGQPLTVQVQRGDKHLTLTLTPVAATDGHYRVGMWVRDSTAGLGTLTFYHPASGTYGGLGHAVCDSDTGKVMSLAKGEIVAAQVQGLTKASVGNAGELRGTLVDNQKLGSIALNCRHGVYGQLYAPPKGETMRVARKQAVKTGDALVYACVDGQVQAYSCTIQRVNLKESADHHMVVRITDPALLQKTGGIVQGMSGSPIVQNGMLVGAITHVFLNQPEKGYGIFAETMLESARIAAASLQQAS